MAFNAQKNDSAKFTEGTWVDIFGGKFKVARAGNPNYAKAQKKHQSRHEDSVDPEESQRRLYVAIAESILVDWDEVEDAEGQPIKHTVDNVVQVLTDNPDLVNAVLAEANRMENFRRDDLDTSRGKSSKRSAGNSNGAGESKSAA